MIYIAIKKHPNLTIGNKYTEHFDNPCVFNAAVKNDKGYVEIFPRNKFFKVINNEKINSSDNNRIA